MQSANKTAARAKRAERQNADPRFAALARLLARHAARQELEKELSRSQDAGYDSDSPAGDAS